MTDAKQPMSGQAPARSSGAQPGLQPGPLARDAELPAGPSVGRVLLVVAGLIALLVGLILTAAGLPLYGRCALTYGECAPGVGFLALTGLGGLIGSAGAVMVAAGSTSHPAGRSTRTRATMGIALLVAAVVSFAVAVIMPDPPARDAFTRGVPLTTAAVLACLGLAMLAAANRARSKAP